MSDEEKIMVEETVEEEKAPEYSADEQKAMEMGWSPDKDSLPEGKAFVEAATFLDRQPLFEKIEDLKKHHKAEMRDMKKVIQEMSGSFRKNEERGRMQELQEVQKQRMSAVEEGDMEAFASADEQYAHLQKESVPVRYEEQDSVPQEALDFKDRNSSWFNFDSAENGQMSMEANMFDQQLHNARPGIDPGEAARMIEEHVHNKFPHRFKNMARGKPSSVESSQPARSGSKTKHSMQDLSANQRAICNDLTSSIKGYTVEKYIKGLEDAGAKIGE